MTNMAKLKISVLHKLFSFFVAIGVALSVAAPFAITVMADSQTYGYIDDGCQHMFSVRDGSQIYEFYYEMFTSDGDVRCLYEFYNNRNILVLVSLSEFTYNYRYGKNINACAVTSYSSGSYEIDGTTYYIAKPTLSLTLNEVYYDLPQYSSELSNSDIVSYTFGENAIGPEPPEPDPNPDLLGLKNLRYNTRLVGHGTQGYQNIDEITWDPGRDLGENFLVGGTVQIRAVSGKYAALTYDGLKALSIGDFSFVGNPVVLASDIVATVGSFSVTWQTVYNSLSLTALNIKAYQDAAGYWNREGWVYQYRYKLDNSTTTTDYSDWFTVYSFTSASGDSTVGLDNNLVAQPGSDGLYNNVVDSFNDINTINADIANNYNTNNYYYIDNNQYLINPDTTQQNTEQQGTWDQFTYKFHEYHDSEDLLINDMNNAIEDLTPSADLNSNNNFLNAANWVKVQFDRMTLNTPMELIIIFSLTLGFGLLLIGRFK